MIIMPVMLLCILLVFLLARLAVVVVAAALALTRDDGHRRRNLDGFLFIIARSLFSSSARPALATAECARAAGNGEAWRCPWRARRRVRPPGTSMGTAAVSASAQRLRGGWKAVAAGMNAKGAALSLVASWRRPDGTAVFDLHEVDADSLFPVVGEDVLEEAAGGAAGGAASGAPVGREKKMAHPRGSSIDASLSDSDSPSRQAEDAEAQAKDKTSGSDAVEEDPRGAASGALPSDLRGMSADDQARARRARRRAQHFADVARRPARKDMMFLCSQKNLKKRRQRILDLVEVLQRASWPVPSPLAFQDGIPHVNSGDRFKGQKLDVAQSLLAAQNVHFPGLPQTKLESDSIDSERFFFCEAFPSLEPASGGAPRAESVRGPTPSCLGDAARHAGGEGAPRFLEAHLQQARRMPPFRFWPSERPLGRRISGRTSTSAALLPAPVDEGARVPLALNVASEGPSPGSHGKACDGPRRRFGGTPQARMAKRTMAPGAASVGPPRLAWQSVRWPQGQSTRWLATCPWRSRNNSGDLPLAVAQQR